MNKTEIFRYNIIGMYKIKNKKFNSKKLLDYGFTKNKDGYIYSIDICNKDFLLTVAISKSNEIKTKLIEKSTNEVYTLHLAKSAVGDFVGKIRDEYNKILEDITLKCFDMDIFESDYTYKVIGYAMKKYGDKEEYLWPKFPRNAVCRRKDNQKWYLAILSVNGTKLGLKDEIIEVLDIRAPKDEVPELLKNKYIYPAYHMNKKSWITIVLDGSCPIEEIFSRIDTSYNLAK